MKTFVISLVLIGAVAVSGTSLVRTAEPPSSLPKGKVLILKNEYTMEGDIEHVGDRYRVRRAQGETWIPAERALSLVASMSDAYAYFRSRVNLDDADERLRLARWCRRNGLRQQALTELKAAAALRPDHAETQRLLQRWQQTALTLPAPKSATPLATQPDDRLPPVEVTSESLGVFATRVQPILMNTCARCHATGRGGKFHLTQAYQDSVSNRRTLERNLASVLTQINLQQPDASRLLSKAISDHAHTGQAPLRDRQSAPYRTLENWVKLTVANNPHLLDSLPAAAATPAPGLSISPQPEEKGKTAPFAERRSTNAESSQWGADARPVAAPKTVPPTSPVSANTAATPIQPTPPADPYDPEPFNRQAHPEAKPNK